jgi:quinol-cytochrome oxidoreductase complex cytochrome b subunit/coenzyme F420-reducing hydrogenase delta subunit
VGSSSRADSPLSPGRGAGGEGRIHALDESIGAALDRLFPPAHNPWRHLGSLAFLFFIVCLLSGIYAYIVFDTSLEGAYASGKALTEDPWLVGRLVRGLHRYSADAFMLVTVLHLVREMARGHFRAYRAWSWISGVALIPILWIAGLVGFWLAWDQLALWSLTATAEWFAAIPALAGPITRNFLTLESMNDRFFSFLVFVHIGVPLILLAATWIHFARLAHVRSWPPRSLGIACVAMLAILSLVQPVASLGRADALSLGSSIALDWFYLAPLALVSTASPIVLWLLVAALGIALVWLPWIGRRPVAPPAVVELSQCNGCARCAADCPFGAVVMIPRTDGRNHPRQAHVLPDLCAACGICAGACPSSTPFRRVDELTSGIDLPQLPVSRLRDQLDKALEAANGPVVVFTCAQARLPSGRYEPAVREISVECAAMVPPAFVEYALRSGARGVVLAGCRESDCEFRLGDRWVAERFATARDPVLRPTVARDRVAVIWAGRDRERVDAAIQDQSLLQPAGDSHRPARRASPLP